MAFLSEFAPSLASESVDLYTDDDPDYASTPLCSGIPPPNWSFLLVDGYHLMRVKKSGPTRKELDSLHYSAASVLTKLFRSGRFAEHACAAIKDCVMSGRQRNFYSFCHFLLHDAKRVVDDQKRKIYGDLTPFELREMVSILRSTWSDRKIVFVKPTTSRPNPPGVVFPVNRFESCKPEFVCGVPLPLKMVIEGERDASSVVDTGPSRKTSLEDQESAKKRFISNKFYSHRLFVQRLSSKYRMRATRMGYTRDKYTASVVREKTFLSREFLKRRLHSIGVSRGRYRLNLIKSSRLGAPKTSLSGWEEGVTNPPNIGRSLNHPVTLSSVLVEFAALRVG